MEPRKKILITGASGFIGRNLLSALRELDQYDVMMYDVDSSFEELREYVENAEIIYHLAGANRPADISDYNTTNIGLTHSIIDILKEQNLKKKIVFSSSMQAVLNNPYGESKKAAENILIEYSKKYEVPIEIYRLANVFGKWCRPNYNSVVATFCYNIANDKEININNNNSEVNLIYIDDVIKEFLELLEGPSQIFSDYRYIKPSFTITLKELADTLYSFKKQRNNLTLPDFSELLNKYLYSTYLSYLPDNMFNYGLISHHDDRGNLTEIIKSDQFGQLFVSITKPGITRGNHYHHTKVEKFCVLKGNARINFRQIDEKRVVSYEVSGNKMEIVDIPPGYTHNIENIGDCDMIVLFWTNEKFNKEKDDTHYLMVN